MIRINSQSARNEMAVAKYISAYSRRRVSRMSGGNYAGRGVVIGRLQEAPLPDAANALMLLAHQDRRRHPPSGLWTRSARSSVGLPLGKVQSTIKHPRKPCAVVALKRTGARLGRDVLS